MTTTHLVTVPDGRAVTSRLWPDPHDGAAWPVFAAVAAAALATALTRPYAGSGLAGLISGLAVCSAPVAVVVTSRAARHRLLRPLPMLASVGVVALLAVGTVRAAWWLTALCALAALGLGSYALAGGRRWPGVLASAVLPPAAALRAIGWFSRGVSRGVGTVRHPLRGLAVGGATVLLLTVFGALFAGADAAFARVFTDLLPQTSTFDLVGRGLAACCAVALAGGAAFAARMPPRADRLAGSGDGRLRTVEWAVPVGALVVLFAAFVAVQFAVLFGGDEHVQLTSGLTYAEYARGGFGHLVVVTLLTLAVLAAVGRLAPRESSRDRLLVRLLVGALCMLTLVVVASALYRMHLYQEAYGFTRLRVLVTLFEGWLGTLFVLVVAAGVRMRAGWLPRTVVGTAAVAVLGLAVANPDALIAERNVARYEQTGKIDVAYVGQLSADAVPVLDRLPEPVRSCALRPSTSRVDRHAPWYAHSLADRRAERLLSYRQVQDTPCP